MRTIPFICLLMAVYPYPVAGEEPTMPNRESSEVEFARNETGQIQLSTAPDVIKSPTMRANRVAVAHALERQLKDVKSVQKAFVGLDSEVLHVTVSQTNKEGVYETAKLSAGMLMGILVESDIRSIKVDIIEAKDKRDSVGRVLLSFDLFLVERQPER